MGGRKHFQFAYPQAGDYFRLEFLAARNHFRLERLSARKLLVPTSYGLNASELENMHRDWAEPDVFGQPLMRGHPLPSHHTTKKIDDLVGCRSVKGH